MNAPIDSARYRFYGIQPVLEVADVEATAAWYCDILGFSLDFVDMASGGHARVSIGGGGRQESPAYAIHRLPPPPRH